MENITIRDIAQKAGVSIATVSRAINNSPKIAPKTKKIIEDIIEEYDFRPNVSARDLKTKSNKTIALLISDESSEYYFAMVQAINEIVGPEGYNIILCNSFNNPKTEMNYISLLANRNADCIILNRCYGNEEAIARLSQKMPIILLHRKLEDPGFHGDFVDVDFGHSTYAFTKKLLSFGHRKIGIISGPLVFSSFRDRFDGFCRAMAFAGTEVDTNYGYFLEGTTSSEFGYEAMKKLLSLPDPPTAIVICHNLTCIGAVRYCRENGIRIPEDISIVTPCNLNLSDLFYVRIFSAIPDIHAMGNYIGRLALDRMRGIGGDSDTSMLFQPIESDGNSILRIS